MKVFNQKEIHFPGGTNFVNQNFSSLKLIELECIFLASPNLQSDLKSDNFWNFGDFLNFSLFSPFFILVYTLPTITFLFFKLEKWFKLHMKGNIVSFKCTYILQISTKFKAYARSIYNFKL